MLDNVRGLWPVLLKAVLPSVLASLGAVGYALDSGLMQAFCGGAR